VAGSFIASAAAAGTTSAIDTTGADLLVAVVSDGASPSISDSKGNTWIGLTEQNQFTINYGRLFYCQGGTVGSGHTFTGSGSISVLAFSGSASSPFDVENGTAASGQFINPGSITPSQANDILIAAVTTHTQATLISLAIDQGYTLGSIIQGAGGGPRGAALAYFIQTTAAAKNPQFNWTGSPTFITGEAAAFKTASGGGSTLTGAGSATGASTVAAVGAATAAGDGSSAGLGAAAAVGAATASGDGSAAGVGVVNAVGDWLIARPGSRVIVTQAIRRSWHW
jgi:hypothetical protein